MNGVDTPAVTMPPAVANPYVRDDGGFQLVDSVLCYLDVLGYQKLIGAGNETIQRHFYNALTDSYPAMLTQMGYDPDVDDESWFALKTFTDNIVIARPINGMGDGESELGLLTLTVAALQTNLALNGFFVRGGIACGPCYVDDFGVFGEALLEAYNAESQYARDPRIVLAPSAKERVQQHIQYYKDPISSPQNATMRVDSDNEIFVNYLEHLAPAPDEGGFGFVEVCTHRDVVVEKLEQFRDQPSLFEKYAWVARYHNHFCERYEHLCDESYVVPQTSLERGFEDLGS